VLAGVRAKGADGRELAVHQKSHGTLSPFGYSLESIEQSAGVRGSSRAMKIIALPSRASRRRLPELCRRTDDIVRRHLLSYFCLACCSSSAMASATLSLLPRAAARMSVPRIATRIPVLGATRLFFHTHPRSFASAFQRTLVRRPLRARQTRLASTGSTSGPRDSHSQDLPPDASFSQKLKHLIKRYGFYAVGVYLLVGAVDLGLVFATINFVGAEKVSHWVAIAKAHVKALWSSEPDHGGEVEEAANDAAAAQSNPKSAGKSNEGIWAMAVLAYTIHKTLLLPFRVGVTATVTPGFVGWLTRRGWAGRQGTMRAAQHVREKYGRNKERLSRD
jgi:N-terminal acetyltransferase 2